MKANTLFVIFCLLVTGCVKVTPQPTEMAIPETPTIQPTMETLPNPASVYCEQQGYMLEIRTAEDGSQSGVCVFPDGSECDEWAYFRGECKPASMETPTGSSEYDSNGWNIYMNDALGYSFHYPAEAQVTTNDEPLKSLYISGPGMGSETWGIAHPSDRDEFRPPEDADLLQWLTDHYLLGEKQMPDEQIAGTTAIHFRHEASPQSYANDLYYFARQGQLYVITIGHSSDIEDWELNIRFLQSFQFEEPTSNTSAQTPIPTAVPIEAGYYQGFWTYTHPVYGFSIMLPEDWGVDETTTDDPMMNGHMLILHPQPATDNYPTIRMTFRSIGEDALLWPTGVGQGEFFPQGTLDIASQTAQRIYFVCPNGEINSIWYQGGENQANIQRGNMEFAFIYSYSGVYCQEGYSLTGKVQLVGEMIIASLNVP
jgi:putative hemolysin